MTNILLIGCTGCLGHAIIYKLLTTTNNKLYIVIREKHDQTIEQRLHSILSSMNLQLSSKEIKKRIKLIQCSYDASRKILISDRDMKTIKKRIHIFINALADIKFNRELHKAAENNITTALNWLDIYNSCKKTKQYTYVSTAFTGFHTGSNNPIIKEEFHINTCKEQTFEHCDETYAKIMDKQITNSDIYPFENSYTYTKNLAEIMINKYIKKGALYIVRPSIILSAVSYPYPGWGKFQTLNVALLGMCTGKLLYYNYDGQTQTLNTTPVDLVADDCCKTINQPVKIVHSCMSKNSPQWNINDTTIMTTISQYCYNKYKDSPITYNDIQYYPFKTMVFQKRYDFFVYIIYCILLRFITNIKYHGIYSSLNKTFKQLMFSIKFNGIFNKFSNKNYTFERTEKIHDSYKNISQQEHIIKFIDNIPQNVKNDKNLYSLFTI